VLVILDAAVWHCTLICWSVGSARRGGLAHLSRPTDDRVAPESSDCSREWRRVRTSDRLDVGQRETEISAQRYFFFRTQRVTNVTEQRNAGCEDSGPTRSILDISIQPFLFRSEYYFSFALVGGLGLRGGKVPNEISNRSNDLRDARITSHLFSPTASLDPTRKPSVPPPTIYISPVRKEKKKTLQSPPSFRRTLSIRSDHPPRTESCRLHW